MKTDCSFDNKGRRCGGDRREFDYSGCIPERRCREGDRRSGKDRRVHDRVADSEADYLEDHDIAVKS